MSRRRRTSAWDSLSFVGIPRDRETRRYRSSSPEYSPDRRRFKSDRLSSVYPLRQQEPFASWEECSPSEPDKIDVRRLNNLAEEYNRFLPFCKDRGIEDKESNVVRRGYGIEQSIRDIERIVEEARMKVKHRCDELEHQLDKFIVATAKQKSEAYLRGNLLDLRYSELKDFLLHLKVRDAGAFSTYVLHRFERTMKRSSPLLGQKGWLYERNNFMEKSLSLVQHMIDIEQKDMVLHALVTLKSVHRNGNKYRREDDLGDAHEYLDDLIRAFVSEKVPSGDRSCSLGWSSSTDEGRRDHHKDDHVCHIEFGDLRWPSAPKDQKRRYRNFALATRILSKEYFHKPRRVYACVFDGSGSGSDQQWYDDDDYGHSHNFDCFHRSSTKMLEWLQTRAWSEIRGNVMLTAGSLLPAEIAERVFEFALRAEEIPAHPSVKETVDSDSSKIGRRWTKRGKMRRRNLVRMKSLYRCQAIKERGHDRISGDSDSSIFGDSDTEEDDDPGYERVDLEGTFMDFTSYDGML